MRKAKNYRFREKILCLALGCAIGITGAFFVLLPLEAKAAENTGMGSAKQIELNVSETVTFEGMEGEEYWYTFTVPEDIGNQWIEIAATNFTDSSRVHVSVYDYYECICEYGSSNSTYRSGISVLSTGTLQLWAEGSGYNGSIDGIFVPGKTYYIKVDDNTYASTGNIVLQVKTVSDDNWGTIEKAEKLKNDKTVKRELENSKDVDTYKIKCSKGQNYTLMMNGDVGEYYSNNRKIYVYDSDGILLDSYSTSSGNKTIYFSGDGSTQYISILGNVSGEYSLTFYKNPSVGKVKGVILKKNAKGNKKIKWKNVKGADGYVVNYLDSNRGKYYSLGTTKKRECEILSVNSDLLWQWL